MSEGAGKLDVVIEKRLGSFRLDVAFSMQTHGLAALFGRSGSGKTSIVSAIAGLIRPDAGRIVADGVTLFDSARGIEVPVESRRIGYIFQDARLFPHLSVRDNLAYGLKRAPKGDHSTRWDTVIELLGIGHLLDRRPHKLSGGEKQRVAIGRALLAQPRLLLMDEPLASLDRARRQEILPYIERLRDEAGILIVYVSHAIEEVVRLANAVVVVDEGRTMAQGSVVELAERLDLRPLLGRFEAGSVIVCRIEAHDDERQLTRATFGQHTLLLPRFDVEVGAVVRVRIRARDVILAITPPAGLSVQNVLAGVVREIADEPGAFAEVKLDVGDHALVARVTKDSTRRLALTPGRTVYALVKSVAIDRQSVSAAPSELD